MKKENIIQELRKTRGNLLRGYRITPESWDFTWRDNVEYMRFLAENWNEEKGFWVKLSFGSQGTREGCHITAKITDKTLFL